MFTAPVRGTGSRQYWRRSRTTPVVCARTPFRLNVFRQESPLVEEPPTRGESCCHIAFRRGKVPIAVPRQPQTARLGLLVEGVLLAAAAVVLAVGHHEPRWLRIERIRLDPPRRGLEMAPLPDGRVLLVGGTGYEEDKSDILGEWRSFPVFVKRAEIYDPVANTLTPTGPFSRPHWFGMLASFKDGRALVYGRGPDQEGICELFDPDSGQWSATGSLLLPRDKAPAVVLANGHVLVAGGYDDDKSFAACELFDPDEGTWRQAAPLNTPRTWHFLVALRDGGALLIDVASQECERYDAEADRWSPAASPLLHHGYGLAITLGDGRVLLAGGMRFTPGDHPRADPTFGTEIYDPDKDEWARAADAPVVFNRTYLTAHLLGTGRVLVLSADTRRTCLLYHPATDRWEKIPSMHTPRFDHASALLPDGRVLVAGGYQGGTGPESQLGDFEILEWE